MSVFMNALTVSEQRFPVLAVLQPLPPWSGGGTSHWMWTEPEPAGTPLRKNKNTHTLLILTLFIISSVPHKQVTFNKMNRRKRMNRVSRKCLYACYRLSQTAVPSAGSPHLCCLCVSLETCHLAKRLSFESDLHKPHDRTRHRRENAFACRRNHTEV